MTASGPVAQLEQTIDKIIRQTEEEILSGMESAAGQSSQALDDAIPALEQEYEKIIADGRKEADKISRQIVGSADLEVRNRQLLALEDAVDGVFVRALEEVAAADRNGADYAALLHSLLAEAVSVLGSSDVVVHASAQDRDAVQGILSSDYAGAELAPEPLGCMGGVRIQSKDGAMTFDNTLDARIERLKPLIRKGIASKFGAGN